MDTARKTGIDAAKISKRVVQKTAEAPGELIENIIADKIISLKKKAKKVEETYIPPEKRKAIIDDFKLF